MGGWLGVVLTEGVFMLRDFFVLDGVVLWVTVSYSGLGYCGGGGFWWLDGVL